MKNQKDAELLIDLIMSKRMSLFSHDFKNEESSVTSALLKWCSDSWSSLGSRLSLKSFWEQVNYSSLMLRHSV